MKGSENVKIRKPYANDVRKYKNFEFASLHLHKKYKIVKLTKRVLEGIRMSNALKWAGYFAIITGIIIAIYLITSLKVIDINAIDYQSPHPYRWLYASLVLAVTMPTGLMSVAASSSRKEIHRLHIRRERTEK